jgi:hypothetical protein
MIKKVLKKFHFIKKNNIFEFNYNNNLFDDLIAVGVENQLLTYVNNENTLTFNNGVNNNILTVGEIWSLGSVRFNLETRKLNYWDGNQWIEIE